MRCNWTLSAGMASAASLAALSPGSSAHVAPSRCSVTAPAGVANFRFISSFRGISRRRISLQVDIERWREGRLRSRRKLAQGRESSLLVAQNHALLRGLSNPLLPRASPPYAPSLVLGGLIKEHIPLASRYCSQRVCYGSGLLLTYL